MLGIGTQEPDPPHRQKPGAPAPSCLLALSVFSPKRDFLQVALELRYFIVGGSRTPQTRPPFPVNVLARMMSVLGLWLPRKSFFGGDSPNIQIM